MSNYLDWGRRRKHLFLDQWYCLAQSELCAPGRHWTLDKTSASRLLKVFTFTDLIINDKVPTPGFLLVKFSSTKLLLSVEAEKDRAGAKGAMHIGGGLSPSVPPSLTKGQTGLIINLLSHTATTLLELCWDWPTVRFNSKVWISSSSVPLICRNGPVTDLDKYKRQTFGTEVCQGADSSNLCYDNVTGFGAPMKI